MILTAGRSGWWIETELQNRFRLDFRFGFGILGSDDGLAGFSGWERNWGYGQGMENLLIDIWVRARLMQVPKKLPKSLSCKIFPKIQVSPYCPSLSE